MKCLQSKEAESQKRQAEILTEEEEKKGYLVMALLKVFSIQWCSTMGFNLLYGVEKNITSYVCVHVR